MCDTDLVPLHNAQPHAALGAAFTQGVVLAAGRYDFPCRGSFSLPEDWCFLGYMRETGAGSWCNGVSLAPGTAVTLLPGGSTEFMLTAGSAWSAVLLPVSMYRRALSVVTSGPAQSRVLRSMLFDAAESSSGRNLGQMFDAVLDRFVGDGSAQFDAVDELVRTHLMCASACTRPRTQQQESCARRNHYRILRAVESGLMSNLHLAIDTRRMCERACTGERTLRNAFYDLLAISPGRYLSLLRLARAGRLLAAASPAPGTVRAVALECGLWDLSRFARDYHAMFGEFPSTTLAHHAGAAAVARSPARALAAR